MTEEQQPPNTVEVAPGLALAYTPAPEAEQGRHRRRKGGHDPMANLRQWNPKTRLGKMVRNGAYMGWCFLLWESRTYD